ncbi:MAG TPA: hypothetical protein VJ063_03815 [Verrucomicrobiae bacterium]|nr:hypothetical protein [Verrucomicrobiae bacterium]
MIKFLKTCSVYRRPEGYYVFGYMRTDYGSVGQPPVTKTPLTTTPLEIGDVALGTLANVSGEVVKEVNLGQLVAAFRAQLKNVGFRNVAAFEREASVASVEWDGACYKVVSYRKDQQDINMATGSYQFAPTVGREELGKAILASLENVF